MALDLSRTGGAGGTQPVEPAAEVAGWDQAVADVRTSQRPQLFPNDPGMKQGPQADIRVAQAMPLPLPLPLPVPLPPMANPGTPENKAATAPIAAAISWGVSRGVADQGTFQRRVKYLREQLGRGNIGIVARTLLHIAPFPESVNFGRETSASDPASGSGEAANTITPPLNPVLSGRPSQPLPPPPPLITPLPEPTKPQIAGTPIPQQQRPEPIGGGFRPENLTAPQEGFSIHQPSRHELILHHGPTPNGPMPISVAGEPGIVENADEPLAKEPGKIDERDSKFSDEERRIAQFYADRGYDVRAIPRGPQKTPDMTVSKDGHEVAVEIKTIQTENPSRLVAVAAQAQRQSNVVALDATRPGTTVVIATRALARISGNPLTKPGTTVVIIGRDFAIRVTK